VTPSVTLYEDADGNEVARITPPTGPDNCINFNPWGAIRVTEEDAQEVHRQLLEDPARIPTLLAAHGAPVVVATLGQPARNGRQQPHAKPVG
jgi:hypothetical protein